ncbi:MAG: PEP-CTERM sorting domain-containing protein [Myxococcota bacterium]
MLRLPLQSAALLAALLLFTQPAAATGFHGGFDLGISLQDLVDGETFESDNGELVFSDFEADTSGVAPGNLDLYRVFPTEDGFKIFSPLFAWPGHDAQLDLSYDVEGLGGKQVAGMAIDFHGLALGRDAEAGVMATVLSGDDELANLMAGTRDSKGDGGPGWFCGWEGHGGKPDRDDGRSDSVMFKDGYDSISVLEKIFASVGGGKDKKGGWSFGLAKALIVDHSFKTVMVPEPGTLLLLGAAGLALRLRRRS